jgi:hypothetical protein
VFTVTLTVTDPCGEESSCETQADINHPPVCDAGGPYDGMVEQEVQFDGTGSTDPDDSIILYEWDFGDNTTGTGPTPTHTYENPGAFAVTLCVTDEDTSRTCCETTATIAGPTAVDLISFTATTRDGAVALSWRTGHEENHAGFEVLRGFRNTEPFRKISGETLVTDQDGDHVYSFTDPAVDVGTTYIYQLVAVERDGDRQAFTPLPVTVTQELPSSLALLPSRPNPFNPSTHIAFDLPEAGRVSVRIYDGTGRLVRNLVDGESFPAGTHAFPWNGRDDQGITLASGVYLIRLEAGNKLLTEKIVLAR